ncbi:enolase C-terminal domain-like protein [Intrasporangium sp. YIM S08009]|uniref:enolase C-terminal domain-like protein n=1 Tax=Intrasporangium zincisolvens TaxID=3080018 RepID=UPI002B05728D|nr:enolase C-terminal domain-like protein [Intrasporangium sp. YIM S08009]
MYEADPTTPSRLAHRTPRDSGAGRGTVELVRATAFTVPTDAPEADGTIAWDSTTCVVVEVGCDGLTGTGWTYGAPAVAELVRELLAPVVEGRDALAVADLWSDQVRAMRNVGTRGPGAMAVSALDTALWDLRARLLGVPLHQLLGSDRVSVPVYGSGGFTTYSQERTVEQLTGWAALGAHWVKLKIGESWGTCVDRDLERTAAVVGAVGRGVEVFVDANGGFSVGQAVRVGRRLDELGVTWFEEPVSSDDPAGLRHVRERVVADVAAGEYADSLDAVRVLCASGAVDCLQLDVTRIGGITALYRAAAIAQAHHLDVSAHCAPHLSAVAFSAVPGLRHLEYFHDHVRVEELLFDGVPRLVAGCLPLDADASGHGMRLRPDASRWLAGPA